MLRMRNLAVVLIGSSTVAAALIVAACSSSDTTETPVPTVDANKGDTSSPEGDANSGGDTGTDGGTSADCGTVPTLHAPGDGGFFCPFQDGGTGYCANTDTCCDPGKDDGGLYPGKYPASFCAAGKLADQGCASAGPTYSSDYQPQFFSYAFQCDDNTGCTTAGEVCVAFLSSFATAGEVVNVGHTTAAPASCTNNKTLFQAGGTTCVAAASAPAGSKFVCTSTADCTAVAAGTTCVAAAVSSRTLGICTAP